MGDGRGAGHGPFNLLEGIRWHSAPASRGRKTRHALRHQLNGRIWGGKATCRRGWQNTPSAATRTRPKQAHAADRRRRSAATGPAVHTLCRSPASAGRETLRNDQPFQPPPGRVATPRKGREEQTSIANTSPSATNSFLHCTDIRNRTATLAGATTALARTSLRPRCLAARIAEIAEEIAIGLEHHAGVVVPQAGLVGLHRAVEGEEVGIVAEGLGEDAVALGIALAADLLGLGWWRRRSAR